MSRANNVVALVDPRAVASSRLADYSNTQGRSCSRVMVFRSCRYRSVTRSTFDCGSVCGRRQKEASSVAGIQPYKSDEPKVGSAPTFADLINWSE